MESQYWVHVLFVSNRPKIQKCWFFVTLNMHRDKCRNEGQLLPQNSALNIPYPPLQYIFWTAWTWGFTRYQVPGISGWVFSFKGLRLLRTTLCAFSSLGKGKITAQNVGTIIELIGHIILAFSAQGGVIVPIIITTIVIKSFIIIIIRLFLIILITLV